MKKLVIMLLLVALIVPMSAVLAQDEEVALRFTLWVPNDAPHTAMLTEISDAYSEMHPNVSVEYYFVPYGEYESTISLQLQSDDPPDIGWIVERSAPTFTNSGMLLDVGETLRADEEYDFADFAEPVMGLWVDGDAVYAVPFSTSPIITIFNADLFAEAGLENPAELAAKDEWTWEAAAAAAKAIKEETGVYGFVSNDAALYSPAPWGTVGPVLRAYGTDLFDVETGECTFNSPEAAEAMGLLYQMAFADESMVPPGTEALMWTGDAAFTLGQLSRLNNLKEAEFAWGIAPLPSGPAGYEPVIGQAALTVFNGPNNENQEVAADFLKYMTAQAGVETMSQFFPPARESVMASEVFFNANPMVDPADIEGVIAPAITGGRVLIAHQEMPTIELTGATALDTLWVPGADVQGVLDMWCMIAAPYLAE